MCLIQPSTSLCISIMIQIDHLPFKFVKSVIKGCLVLCCFNCGSCLFTCLSAHSDLLGDIRTSKTIKPMFELQKVKIKLPSLSQSTVGTCEDQISATWSKSCSCILNQCYHSLNNHTQCIRIKQVSLKSKFKFKIKKSKWYVSQKVRSWENFYEFCVEIQVLSFLHVEIPHLSF